MMAGGAGGAGGGGSSKSKKRTALGYLAPDLGLDDVDGSVPTPGAGAKAGSREDGPALTAVPEPDVADDGW